jgi:subtilase family serine protease
MTSQTTRCGAAARALVIAAALGGATFASYAMPYPAADTPAPRELGASTARTVGVSVALKQRDVAGLRRLLDELHTPGNPRFRRFLTPAEFHARFDPAPDTVAAAAAYFRAAGLAVAREGQFLQLSGTPAAIRAAFGVELRDYEVAAHGAALGYRFHAPAGEPAIASPAVADSVEAILGLDDRPRFAPRLMSRPAIAGGAAAGARATAPGTPGYLTVKDVAARYDVQPLYDAGVRGEGRTIGIVTLASFTPSDAFRYWSENGIETDPGRIRIVDVQGGPGPVSDRGGSGETTLDVQQAGGLAPAAAIVVYQAPNDGRAFVGAFWRAVDDNVADTISASWGEFEWKDTLYRMHAHKTNDVVLKAFDQVFMQAAAQGQTLIAAQGDAGAFEANREFPLPYFQPVLSVGAPAVSPWITSAGGTTLPGEQHYVVDGKPFVIDIPAERAWGLDYMTDLCAAIGFDPAGCGIWGVGGGGGVSSYFPLPAYQRRVAGMAATEPGQGLVEVDVTPPVHYVDLPAGFAGRNVPDISLNADPNTGFVLDYTTDYGSYGVTAFMGGTSFVAPQLNGIAALLVQKVGGRIGLLNYPMYEMARRPHAWGRANSPFNDITAGANWFYPAVPGYDRSTGLGTLNVANFADALVALQPK